MSPELEKKLQEAAQAGPGNLINGCIIGAATKDGSRDYVKAFGCHRLGESAPLADDAVFWFASCTKFITVIAALQCVEREQITLDDPEAVRRLLPEYSRPEILEVEGVGQSKKFNSVPAAKYFSLRQLLTHTSGIGYDMFPPWHEWRLSTGESPKWMNGDLIDSSLLPLLFEPGTDYKYGAGPDWAGRVIERLNNMSLGDYCQKNIFGVLGITDMTFDLDSRPDLKARASPPVTRQPDGSLQEGPHPLSTRGPGKDHMGGFGLHGTARGFLEVLKAVLRKDERILKAETFDMMTADQITTELGKKTVNEDYSLPLVKVLGLPGLGPGLTWNWGLGGALCKSGQEGSINPGSLTWAGACCPFWQLDFAGGFAFIYLTDMQPLGDPATADLRAFVRRALFKELNNVR